MPNIYLKKAYSGASIVVLISKLLEQTSEPSDIFSSGFTTHDTMEYYLQDKFEVSPKFF